MDKAALIALAELAERGLPDAAIEAAAKAHCDYFGGDGWWETGLLADTLPEARKAMRAALAAALRAIAGGV